MTQSNISNKIDKGIESSSKVGSAWAGEGGVGGQRGDRMFPK